MSRSSRMFAICDDRFHSGPVDFRDSCVTRWGTAGLGDEGPAVGDCGKEGMLRLDGEFAALLDVRGLPFPSGCDGGLGLSLRKNRAAVVFVIWATSRGGELGGDCMVGDVGGQEGFPMKSGAVAGNDGGVAGSGVDGVEPLPPPPRKRRTPFMTGGLDYVVSSTDIRLWVS